MVDVTIDIFRHLLERTGKHCCTLCLAEISAEEFFANDTVCNRCAKRDAHPLNVQD